MGPDPTAPPLTGFELADLTINANLTGAATGASTGAVCVRGSSTYIRRVKVIDYGTKASSSTFSILVLGGDDSENCVATECVIDAPSASHNVTGTTLNLFAFATTATGTHRFCAIRNCAIRGITTSSPPPSIVPIYVGVWLGAGIGTIIEGNQLINLRTGISETNLAFQDIVIQNNYLRNVFEGIKLISTGALSGRVIAYDNIIELSRELASPLGMQCSGSSNNQFADAIFRKNIVRQVPDTTRSPRTDAGGIYFNGCTRCLAENNLLNDIGTNPTPVCNLAVVYENCGSGKFFNNETSAGTLLRAYNKSTTS